MPPGALPTGYSPAQHRQSWNQIIQKTLSQRLGRASGQLSMVILRPPAPTNRDNIESPPTIEFNANSIGLCTYAQQLRLQQNAASPNGLPRPGPR